MKEGYYITECDWDKNRKQIEEFRNGKWWMMGDDYGTKAPPEIIFAGPLDLEELCQTSQE